MTMEITPTISDDGRAAPPRRPVSAARLSVRRILEAAVAEYGLDPAALNGRCRRNRLCEARYLAWWTAFQLYPKLSNKRLGDLSGGYDHTTVIYGINQLRRRMAADEALAARAQAFLSRVGDAPWVRLDRIDEDLNALRVRAAALEAEKAALIQRLNGPGDRA